jgi:ComF family protein
VFDFLFPQKCLACGKEGFAFCGTCRGQIPLETSPICDDVISVWSYDDPMLQKALWHLKYRGKKELARDLAESMYDKIIEPIAENDLFADPCGIMIEKYLVVPIPLHKKRRKERGYNQSELLARELVRLDLSLFSLENKVLMKTKETRSQVCVKNRAERLRNIRGSFCVRNAEKIKGKNILVVDDVTTTGATLAEAKKVLQKSGAKSVMCVTLAH